VGGALSLLPDPGGALFLGLLSIHRVELGASGMVEYQGEYQWSSYGANAQGEESGELTPQVSYRALGTDEQARRTAYRELFRYQLDPGLV